MTKNLYFFLCNRTENRTQHASRVYLNSVISTLNGRGPIFRAICSLKAPWDHGAVFLCVN